MDRSLRRHEIVRHVCWLMALAATVALGRATVIDGESLSLIWPAAGVAVCWVLVSRGSARPWTVLAIGVVVAVGNGVSGASSGLVLGLVAANLTQTLIAAYALEQVVGHLRGCGGREPLVRVGDVGRILLVVLGACLPAALIGTATLALLDSPVSEMGALAWYGRNVIGLLCVVATWLLLLQARAESPNRLGAFVAACFGSRREGLPMRFAELALLLGLTLLPWAGIGTRPDDLLFVLLVLMIWAGLRFAAPAVVAYGLYSGTVGVGFTLADGPALRAIEDPVMLALHVQVVVAVTALTGLALALNRAERDAVVAELAATAREQEAEATKMARILDTVADGLIVIEPDGSISLSNRAARELLGVEDLTSVLTSEEYGLHAMDGKPVRDEDLPYRTALRGESFPARDYQVRRPSVPAGRVVAIGALPLPGEPVRALAHLRDVTAERRQHEALSSFAGVVAHDLINPIALVQGWAETIAVELEDGPLDPAIGAPMVERIQVGAHRMRSLIDDLLGYTLARDAQVLPQAVDVTALVEEIALLRESGPRRPIVQVEPRLVAWADRALVRQLIDNLVGNSIKYTDPDLRPVIAVTGRQQGSWVELRISDNGVGIPPDQREAVFTAFERGGTALSSGTGLGLAICKQIVERHHGTVHAEAGPHGTGTTIVVRLPRTPAAYDEPQGGAVKESVPAQRVAIS
ncbi:ATP-binding protein [Nocardioides massiliensis]|uniref:Sensor-like histidine kinase SenX3 n=1 Tax=Nocardioides massiliensis TaxID=1325935 RepID=A0ABT9NPN8_9ACTN|nr:ATP-binding protein [Nocardioides massiliensis]MDP9822271.1 signal transduction histidine kinase [Nocardioides massiliensis]